MKDINNYANDIDLYGKISSSMQVKLINWFNRQNLLIKMEVFKIRRNEFFKLNGLNLDKEVIDYISLLKGIELLYNSEQLINKKNKSSSLKKIGLISNLEIKKSAKERKKIKFDKLLNHWSSVIKLREEGRSWRDISSYIKVKYRFEVSHTFLLQSYKKLEGLSDGK